MYLVWFKYTSDNCHCYTLHNSWSWSKTLLIIVKIILTHRHYVAHKQWSKQTHYEKKKRNKRNKIKRRQKQRQEVSFLHVTDFLIQPYIPSKYYLQVWKGVGVWLISIFPILIQSGDKKKRCNIVLNLTLNRSLWAYRDTHFLKLLFDHHFALYKFLLTNRRLNSVHCFWYRITAQIKTDNWIAFYFSVQTHFVNTL